jgi:hypothetical protein
MIKIEGETNHKFQGSEFDWIATDRNKKLGYFSTAGAGPIPSNVLASAPLFENILEDIKSLPALISIKDCHTITSFFEWAEIACHGLYVFDWNHALKCYELVAVPTNALFLQQIDNDSLRSLFELATLDYDFDKPNVSTK